MFRTFRGGQSGGWRITSISPVTGEPLPFMPALSVTDSEAIALPLVPSRNAWRLVGVASSLRYTERGEKEQLTAMQAGLGRLEATSAALIPIRKSQAWWDLTQEERRRIFEDKSHHIASSLRRYSVGSGKPSPQASYMSSSRRSSSGTRRWKSSPWTRSDGTSESSSPG